MDVHTNGHSTGASSADESIDLLYAWWPGAQPAPAATLPEMPFSCTLKGFLGGVDCLLTVRGLTPEAFLRNLASIKGLLDPIPGTAPATQADAVPHCPTHGAMKASTKGQGFFCPSRLDDGTYCKSRGK